MKCVLDTDVLVAALRSSKGASRQLLRSALDGEFAIVVSVPLMLEYEAVLTRAEQLAASYLTVVDVEKVLNDIASVAFQVKLAFRWRPMLSDPNDDMVLEAAVNGSADAIVSFNVRDYRNAEGKFALEIIRPIDCLQRIRSLR